MEGRSNRKLLIGGLAFFAPLAIACCGSFGTGSSSPSSNASESGTTTADGAPLAPIDSAAGDGTALSPDVQAAKDGGEAGGARKRTVFVTSSEYKGNEFGSTPGEWDAKCQATATSAGLGGGRQWMAWVSTPASLAAARLGPSDDREWRDLSGTLIAKNRNVLVSIGGVTAAIKLDETGTATSGQVWTGTLADGTAATPDNCDGWNNNAGGINGLTGDCESLAKWTADHVDGCDASNHLYCFEK